MALLPFENHMMVKSIFLVPGLVRVGKEGRGMAAGPPTQLPEAPIASPALEARRSPEGTLPVLPVPGVSECISARS